jgi:integrase/recombinase XerD
MSVTITTILDTRRIKMKTNKYPVKLRVIFDRVTEYYQTIYDLPEGEFKKLSASRVSENLHALREKLKEIERSAKNAAQELDPFSFAEFEKDYIKDHPLIRRRKSRDINHPSTNDSFDYSPFLKRFSIFEDDHSKPGGISTSFFSYIKSKLKEGRIGAAVCMHCSYKSLMKFGGNVCFKGITVSYLNQYEQWLRSKEVSKTTISIYVRGLRTIFNEAIDVGLIKREKCYPFGRRKYRIPSSKNIKKALELSDISKIYYYECNSGIEGEQKGKDFWLFSYFGNGMNVKDIAFLKWKNIQDGYLIFERAKTERSMRSDPKPITVFINEDMWAIIDRWGNNDRSPGNYIFPILEPGMTPLRQYDVVQLFVGLINEWMEKIRKELNITKKITTYVARHTFSTVLKRSGASTEYIQEALGHSDIKTTENYLDSFEKEVKKEYAHRLTSFKHEPVVENDFIN